MDALEKEAFRESLYHERMGGSINIDFVCSSHASFELMNEHGMTGISVCTIFRQVYKSAISQA